MMYLRDIYSGDPSEWDEEDSERYVQATYSIPYDQNIDIQGFRVGWMKAMEYLTNRIGTVFDFPETGGFWKHVNKLKKRGGD